MTKTRKPAAVSAPEVYVGAPLRDLFMLCRAYGVLRFEGSIPGTPNLVKFDLAPMLATEPENVAPSTPQVPASQPESGVKVEPKRGRDGMTAEEQEDLYNRKMDAT